MRREARGDEARGKRREARGERREGMRREGMRREARGDEARGEGRARRGARGLKVAGGKIVVRYTWHVARGRGRGRFLRCAVFASAAVRRRHVTGSVVPARSGTAVRLHGSGGGEARGARDMRRSF